MNLPMILPIQSLQTVEGCTLSGHDVVAVAVDDGHGEICAALNLLQRFDGEVVATIKVCRLIDIGNGVEKYLINEEIDGLIFFKDKNVHDGHNHSGEAVRVDEWLSKTDDEFIFAGGDVDGRAHEFPFGDNGRSFTPNGGFPTTNTHFTGGVCDDNVAQVFAGRQIKAVDAGAGIKIDANSVIVWIQLSEGIAGDENSKEQSESNLFHGNPPVEKRNMSENFFYQTKLYSIPITLKRLFLVIIVKNSILSLKNEEFLK